MENTNKNKKIILIFIILFIMLLIAGILMAKEYILNAKIDKFSDLLTKNQNIVFMYNNAKSELEKDGEKNIEIAISDELLSSTNPLLSLLSKNIKLSTNIVAKNKMIDTTTTLNVGKKEVQKIEFLKENGLIAFNLPALSDEYLSISNENIDELMRKFGFATGDNTNNEEFMSEAKQIYIKYYSQLKKAIKNNVVEQAEEIEINDQRYKAQKYQINLGTIEIDDITLEILKELKDDEKTINFISKAYLESEYYKSTSAPKTVDEFSKELQQKILERYNEIKNKDYTEETIYSNILTINVYEYENKTIKTTVEYKKLDKNYVFELNTISKDKKDYVLAKVYLKEKNEELTLGIKFEGEAKETYIGKVTAILNDASISLLTINVKEIADSTKMPRNINEVKPLLLNKASEYDIELIKKNLMELIPSLDDIKKTNEEKEKYEKGEFELDDPENQVKIIDDYKEKLEAIKIGDKIEDVIAKYGEPGKKETTNSGLETLTWYKDADKKIVLFSVIIRNGTVGTISTTVHSSMENNVQISSEIKTEIEDLEVLANKITIPDEVGKEGTMTKEEVIQILGNGYIETYRNIGGYSVLRWYDKNENVIEVGFDSKDRAWCKTKVIADGHGNLN